MHEQRLPESVDPTWPADQVTAVQEVVDRQEQLDTVAEPAAEEEIHQEIAVEGQGVQVVLERASLVPNLELSGAYPRVMEGERNRGAKARVLQELLADELRHGPCLGHPRVHEGTSGGHAKSGMHSPVRLEFSATNASLTEVLSLLVVQTDRDVRHRVIEQVQEPGGAHAPFARRTQLEAGFESVQRLGS